MPIIVAGDSGAFCHLGHRGANRRDAMEPSFDVAAAPSRPTLGPICAYPETNGRAQ